MMHLSFWNSLFHHITKLTYIAAHVGVFFLLRINRVPYEYAVSLTIHPLINILIAFHLLDLVNDDVTNTGGQKYVFIPFFNFQ